MLRLMICGLRASITLLTYDTLNTHGDNHASIHPLSLHLPTGMRYGICARPHPLAECWPHSDVSPIVCLLCGCYHVFSVLGSNVMFVESLVTWW